MGLDDEVCVYSICVLNYLHEMETDRESYQLKSLRRSSCNPVCAHNKQYCTLHIRTFHAFTISLIHQLAKEKIQSSRSRKFEIMCEKNKIIQWWCSMMVDNEATCKRELGRALKYSSSVYSKTVQLKLELSPNNRV